MRPTLHLLGVPHTLSFDQRHTHCAFTTKVNRFAPMMAFAGYDVIHYGNGPSADTLYCNRGSDAMKWRNVQIFSEKELASRIGVYDPSSPKFVGEGDMRWLYEEFNHHLHDELAKRVEDHDIICLPFGWAHDYAVRGLKKSVFLVETGIGYEDTIPDTFKIYESSAWMHYHCGKRKQRLNDNRGRDYEWVIPNYFDLMEWNLNDRPGAYVLYYGRIAECKGLDIVWEVAKRMPDVQFVMCGQGDPSPWLLPNLSYHPPVHGSARSDLLGKAIAVMCPSRYIEPFGGVAVEAMLCGRPVLSSVFGAFEETLAPHCFRCRTLFDWMAAIDWCRGYQSGDFCEIRRHAERFDMFRLVELYDHALKQIFNLTRGGWSATVCANESLRLH